MGLEYKFNKKELICTDPDELQFAYRKSEDEFTFLQIKTNTDESKYLYNKYKGNPDELLKNAIFGSIFDTEIWFIEHINFNEISDEEKKIISSTYECELDNKLIICEGYFEGLYLDFEYDRD